MANYYYQGWPWSPLYQAVDQCATMQATETRYRTGKDAMQMATDATTKCLGHVFCCIMVEGCCTWRLCAQADAARGGCRVLKRRSKGIRRALFKHKGGAGPLCFHFE